jgi:4-hydroxy-3-methylbut-2-enyl diphosphate reductase
MKIILAKTAGFCMGVRRAVELALDAANKEQGPIYTFGPLIHNPQVLDLLKEKGISVLTEIPDRAAGTVIIRAHGVPPESRDALKKAGLNVIDATCPRVIKVQTIIRKHAREGYAIIIVGDEDHPEVVGLSGYAGKAGHVVDSMEKLEALPAFENAIIVAQTTQNIAFFEKVRQWAADSHPNYKVFGTICDSTQKRQDEIRRLSEEVDAVVVVGGHTSGNTQRLAEIARQTGKPAQAVETEAELDPDMLLSARSVALTAGASTPNWVTNRVYRSVESLSDTRHPGLKALVFKVQRLLLLTSIYVALGAGFLCYTCNKLQGITRHGPYILMSVLYILSMHLLNNLTGRADDRYKDPERARFHTSHQTCLTILALGAGTAGLITAWSLGWKKFVILLVMSAAGLLYNSRLIPAGKASRRVRSIRDIPGSKTVLISLAWGIVTALLPHLSEISHVRPGSIVVFAGVVGSVFVRTAFFDILDMQADRIVGRETIPILMGEKRTIALLKIICGGLLVLMVGSAAAGWITPLGFFLAICPVSLLAILTAYEHGRLMASNRLEFSVETHFLLAGIIALTWAGIA